MPHKDHRCSFCGKPEEESKKLIAGPDGVFICEDCIEICKAMLDETTDKDLIEDVPLKKPAEIKAELDKYIVGQDKAKRVLSVAVYNHYKRINSAFKKQADSDEVEIEKSNILLLGPTGSGKTLLARTLAKILNVPFATCDATTLTEAGYVGEDVENILLKLIQNADYCIEKAERGIIYVDEIDKIARKTENVSITRDVSGEGVQQALLKIIESTQASVPPQGGRKHPGQECLRIDTTNILFICGGAFDGLDKIIGNRTEKSAIGFDAPVESKKKKDLGKVFSQVQPQDLMKFGIIPELIGRMPVITTLQDLKKEDLVRILVEPKNALTRQYQELLRMDDVELEIQPEALKAVAQKAIDRQIGARGLRGVMEKIMLGIMYEIPSDHTIRKVIITPECVEGEKPIVIRDNG